MATDSQAGSVQFVLAGAADYLAKNGIEQPRLCAELLLARLLGCKRLDLYLRHEERLSEKQLEAMRRGVKRVAGQEPVQYVLGRVGFMDNEFKVDRRALIPRPETEVLVQTVLDELSGRQESTAPVLLDVGTGSGCIIISLALALPTAICIGFDVSDEALALARENALALGAATRVAFLGGELSDRLEPETVDAIVTNLPYIRTADYERLPDYIRNHEPRLALDGGPDGLDAIDAVVGDAVILLRSGGRLFMEIGADQKDTVTSLLSGSGFCDVTCRPDLAGRDRVITATLE